jgi:hypothetical protein
MSRLDDMTFASGKSLSTGNATREAVWRRWITLIFAGWLPHCIGTSRGCLCLASGIIAWMPT